MAMPDAGSITTNDFEWRSTVDGRALVCLGLERYARHFFTTREWPLGTAAEHDREAAWAGVARAVGVDGSRLVRADQVHGAAVVVRRRGETVASSDTPPPQADILVADDPSLALAIQTADCVPLLMADSATGAVAAAHAGWRGLAAAVPQVTVAALAQAFGTRPADLIVAIGPSICAARYEVGDEVRQQFEAAGVGAAALARWFLPGARASHWQFDGWASARDQLEAAGVPPASIHGSALCTAGDPDLLCSYRRDGKRAGRIAAAIRAREDNDRPVMRLAPRPHP
jgi:YfiH family protein